MPLAVSQDGALRCIGTAVLIAPGLAITATHAVAGVDAGACVFYLHYGIAYRYDVETIDRSSADVALLRLAMPAWYGDGEGQLTQAGALLSFTPPEPGDSVKTFAYKKAEVVDDILVVVPAESAGTVREAHYEQSNDYGMHPRRYLEPESPADVSLAGGPCFDKGGHVVGVYASDGDVAGAPAAYVALPWPAVAENIELFKTGKFPISKPLTTEMLHAVGHARRTLDAAPAPHNRHDAELVRLIGPYGKLNELLARAVLSVESADDILVLLRSHALHVTELEINVKHYFWDLSSALNVCASIVGDMLKSESDPQLVFENAQNVTDEMRDEYATLAAEWRSNELSDVRGFANLATQGSLQIETLVSGDGALTVALSPCRSDGQQLHLPEGLDRFAEASGAFVARIAALLAPEPALSASDIAEV